MQISFGGYMDISRDDLKTLAREHELPVGKGELADDYAARLCNTNLDRAIQTAYTVVEISNHEVDETSDFDDEYTEGARW